MSQRLGDSSFNVPRVSGEVIADASRPNSHAPASSDLSYSNGFQCWRVVYVDPVLVAGIGVLPKESYKSMASFGFFLPASTQAKSFRSEPGRKR